AHQLQRFGTVLARDGCESCVRQQPGHRVEEIGLVVDQQDRWRASRGWPKRVFTAHRSHPSPRRFLSKVSARCNAERLLPAARRAETTFTYRSIATTRWGCGAWSQRTAAGTSRRRRRCADEPSYNVGRSWRRPCWYTAHK